jgi:hypothetical protein
MDKVHIVFKGRDHEGAPDVKGVFTTRSAAEQKVTELLARWHDEDGRPTYKPRGENECQNADVARIVDALEKDFLRLRGKPFDETLTLAIVGALRPAAGDLSEFFRGYSTFVATNAAKLEHVFAEYETDYRHLLLGQPESLLIFYLKEHNPSALEEHWPSSVPEKLLDGLGGVWVPADSV